MSQIITARIDVTKILKDAMYVGAKGTYLDITIFVKDEVGQYGDNGMVTQDLGKDRRLAGEKGPILGNCKVVGGNAAPAQQDERRDVPRRAPAPVRVAPPANDLDDDIPF